MDVVLQIIIELCFARISFIWPVQKCHTEAVTEALEDVEIVLAKCARWMTTLYVILNLTSMQNRCRKAALFWAVARSEAE